MSFWRTGAKPPSPSLVTELQEKVVTPLVANVSVRPHPAEGESLARAIERSMGSYRPEYAETLRAQIRLAKAECKAAGVDYDKVVSELAQKTLDELRSMARASDSELVQSRTTELPEDRVFYSWQSPENAARLLENPAGYWAQIEKAGFFMAEATWSTSGYRGGSAQGELVEIRIAKGTPFADLTPRSVKRELQARQLWHNHANTTDGTLKPLNRYDEAAGWWQLTRASDATFHRFEASGLPTKDILVQLEKIQASGLASFLNATNPVLLQRGETAEDGLATSALQVLDRRLADSFAEWQADGAKQFFAPCLVVAAARLDLASRFPALLAGMQRELQALSLSDLQMLAGTLPSLRMDDGPAPIGSTSVAQAIAQEAERRTLGNKDMDEVAKLNAISASVKEAMVALAA